LREGVEEEALGYFLAEHLLVWEHLPLQSLLRRLRGLGSLRGLRRPVGLVLPEVREERLVEEEPLPPE
jgi:hypothetical protein